MAEAITSYSRLGSSCSLFYHRFLPCALRWGVGREQAHLRMTTSSTVAHCPVDPGHVVISVLTELGTAGVIRGLTSSALAPRFLSTKSLLSHSIHSLTMASTLLFMVLVIAVVIALIVVSVFAAIGASNLAKSASYLTDPHAKSAHQSLTIAAALGWVSVVVLVVVLIMGFFVGGFTASEISDAILQKRHPSSTEVAAAAKSQMQLESGRSAQVVVLILLILVSIVTFVIGALGVHAAIQANDIALKDDVAKSAYIQSIIVAVVGIGTIGILIVALVSWISIRAARADTIAKLEAFEQKGPVPAVSPALPALSGVQPLVTTEASNITAVPHLNLQPSG